MQSIDQFLTLNKSNTINIAVIGDTVIDEFYNIKISRISPEFPTQIMHSNDWHPLTVMPGGAANVCLQMSNGFNINCFLVCLADQYGMKTLSKQPFNSDYCVILSGKDSPHMPLKRRFYDGDYPLPRWDIESENYGLNNTQLKHFQQELLNNLEKLLSNKKIDIVILSDYGKGVFNNHLGLDVIKICNKFGIKTIVDPKNPPIDQWKGCTYFKPNAFEAVKMTGIPRPNYENGESWWDHYNLLNERYGIHGVVITDGPNIPFVPIKNADIKLAREPNKQSVIGAGDCFCAFLSMCLAHGMQFDKAVEVGWNASSLYIESKHNKPLMPHELDKWNDPIKSKIVSVDELKSIMNYDKSSWVWTNGCFDIIHIGHLKTLEAAKKCGDKVIVGLNTDESIKKLKGPHRPIVNYEQRSEHLAHLQYVDFIVPIEEDTPLNIIKKLKPNTILKGEEYRNKYVAGSEFVHEWGGKMVFVPMVDNLSTTNIVDKIKKTNGQ